MFLMIRRLPVTPGNAGTSLVCTHRAKKGRPAASIQSRLLHSKRGPDGPRQEHVMTLPTVRSCCLDDAVVRDLFWKRVGERLDGLKLSVEERVKIESDIVEKLVKRPEAAP